MKALVFEGYFLLILEQYLYLDSSSQLDLVAQPLSLCQIYGPIRNELPLIFWITLIYSVIFYFIFQTLFDFVVFVIEYQTFYFIFRPVFGQA